MKRIIKCSLAIALLTFSSGTFAQDEQTITRPRHEINIGVTDFLNRKDPQPTYFYPNYYLERFDLSYYAPEEQPYTLNTKFGLGYKYHFGYNAIRFSFAWGMDGSESKNGPENGSETKRDNKFYTGISRIGFERTLVRKEKFDFFLALDAEIQQSNTTYESTQESTGQTYKSKNELDYDAIGGGLVIGLRYFVHKNISLATETRMDYSSYTQTRNSSSSSTGTYPSSYESKDKEEGNKTTIIPLATFSVNVHF